MMVHRRAPFCEDHRDFCHLAACRDCLQEKHASSMYFVVPPFERRQVPFRICVDYWDGVIGAALMEKLR